MKDVLITLAAVAVGIAVAAFPILLMVFGGTE